ncbi:MAG: molybdopterin-dependent oxidoreductase [Defluviitaleaceae bacterium]|nr:molybdopterin-dependent oxidoreductase [Defluviitaleaceae bacterium]
MIGNVYETAMLQHTTMETHSATALYDQNGLTVWSPSQSPFMLQLQLADAFKLPMTKVRLITTEIGGSFGNKYELRAEPLAIIAAMRLPGRPVRLVFDRHEEFMATGVRGPCRVRIKTAADKNGNLLAQDIQVYWDTGAYVTTGPRINYNAGYGACTPYKIPNMRIDGYCVMTNKQLGTAYRGFGATEVAWAYENQMDILAQELGMDAVELRLLNLLDDGDTSASGEKVVSVGTVECLRAVAKSIGWETGNVPGKSGDAPGKSDFALGNSDTAPGKTYNGKLRGKGVACFSKITGTPSNSSVILKFNSDATVTVMTGGKEMGQGVETIIPQIVAESLGVRVEDVEVAPVDTLYSPFEKTTTGSRLTFHVGRAALGAVEDIKKQIRVLASEYWNADVNDITLENGVIREKRGEKRSITISEIERSGIMKEQKPVIGRCSLSTLDIFDPPDKKTGLSKRPAAMWFWGAQAAEVEVDPDTGRISVLKIAAAHDVGKAINPMNCKQQIEGAVVMGIGSALTEEMIFDEQARLLNGNLVDYKVPTSMDADIPVEVILIEKPHPEGPYGAKGVGEPGLVPTAAAIGNAVAAATGIRLTDLPMKPENLIGAMGRGKQC